MHACRWIPIWLAGLSLLLVAGCREKPACDKTRPPVQVAVPNPPALQVAAAPAANPEPADLPSGSLEANPEHEMDIHGNLSREAIIQVLRGELRGIQHCYDKHLQRQPELAGKLIMQWTISPSGRVAVVKTKHNTMQTPAVAMCLSSIIRKWKFPRPESGNVVVSYPLVFNSVGFDSNER